MAAGSGATETGQSLESRGPAAGRPPGVTGPRYHVTTEVLIVPLSGQQDIAMKGIHDPTGACINSAFDEELPETVQIETSAIAEGDVVSTSQVPWQISPVRSWSLPQMTRNDLKQVSTPVVDDRRKKIKKWTIANCLCNCKERKNTTDTLSQTGSDDNVQSHSYTSTCQKKMADRKPFLYCRLVTQYPKTSFLLTLSGHILIAMVTLILLYSGYDLFPTEYEILPMFNWRVPWRKRDFAWRYKDEYDHRYIRKPKVDKRLRSTPYARANIVLYYDTGDGNIFTRENLQQIKTLEEAVTSLPEYSQFCVQDSRGRCTKPSSILRLFDGTYAYLNPIFQDPFFLNIPRVLFAAYSNSKMKAEMAYYLSKDHVISSTIARSSITRSVIPIGYPLRLHQDKEQMEDAMKRFLAEKFKPEIESLKESVGGFTVYYWSFLLFMHDILQQIVSDLLLALGSVLFIFCFIVYHTKSLWISALAVLSIATGFLGTNMIYRIVIDFRYFGYFHVISIFIILGIGADDIFIFIDVWKNTAFTHYESLAHRLSDAYRKSMQSMFFTSLTTAAAFFTSALSPLLATQSFGIFAGILVIVNYISVVIFFPTVVIMHHMYFKKCCKPCFNRSCFCWRRVASGGSKMSSASLGMDNKGADIVEHQCVASTTNGVANGPHKISTGTRRSSSCDNKETDYGFLCQIRRVQNSDIVPVSVLPTITEATIIENHIDAIVAADNNCSTSKAKKKLLVRFFRDYYFRFVTHGVVRWVIVGLLLATVLGFAYSASFIEPDNEQLQAKLYRPSHNYGRALDHDSRSFIASRHDRNVVVDIAWGLSERDVSGCHFSDSRCIGVEKYDDTFDPNTPEAQIALLRFCEKLKKLSPEEISELRIRKDFTSGHLEVKCFAYDLQEYLKKLSMVTNDDKSLPWDYNKVMTVMQRHQDIYSPQRFNRSFRDHFEIPISLWLNDGYAYRNISAFQTFHDLIGEEMGPFSTPAKTDLSVFYGNRIRYLGVQVNLTLGAFTTGYSEGFPVMDRWEEFVQQQMRQMPVGLRNGFQLTKDTWHMLVLQKAMADNAILGIVVGVSLALPLLIIATRNVIVGTIATLCICCSTVCVIGITPLAGWKLGILESLNMCMLVGLSVDYAVHLAEGYHMSKHTDKLSRVQDMLEEIGISVFSGACTTLGASIFMLFAQIQFFIQFGIFMLCTIGFSLVFSLGLFTTVMGLIGPSNDTGDIGVIWNKFRKCFDSLKRRDSAPLSRATSTEQVAVDGR